MTIDPDLLIEVYSTLKQYIPQKDRQEAADNLISVLVDMLGDAELQEFGALDSNLKKSLKEYVVDEDTDDYYEDE